MSRQHKEGNLLLAQLLGTKLHFLGPCDGDTRNRHMEELLNKYQSEGERPFAVRNGATTAEARWATPRRWLSCTISAKSSACRA